MKSLRKVSVLVILAFCFAGCGFWPFGNGWQDYVRISRWDLNDDGRLAVAVQLNDSVFNVDQLDIEIDSNLLTGSSVADSDYIQKLVYANTSRPRIFVEVVSLTSEDLLVDIDNTGVSIRPQSPAQFIIELWGSTGRVLHRDKVIWQYYRSDVWNSEKRIYTLLPAGASIAVPDAIDLFDLAGIRIPYPDRYKLIVHFRNYYLIDTIPEVWTGDVLSDTISFRVVSQ